VSCRNTDASEKTEEPQVNDQQRSQQQRQADKVNNLGDRPNQPNGGRPMMNQTVFHPVNKRLHVIQPLLL